MTELNRRSLLAGAVLALILQNCAPALADGGDGNGGSGGGGEDSGGGGEDSGGDNSGGGGSDDDDNDDDSSGGGGGGGNPGSGGPGNGGQNGGSGKKGSNDQYLVQKAVAKGKAVSLVSLKVHLTKNYPGKILKLRMEKRLNGFVYKVRILQEDNRVKNLTLDARTLQRKLF